MGSSEVEEPSDDELFLNNFKSSVKPLTFSEQLDEWCAYYMSIGVPYEEFWFGDYCKLKYYIEAHRLKKRMANERLWLQGLYNYEGFATVLSRGFNKQSTAEYPKKPYEVVEKTEREKQIEVDEARRKVIQNLNQVADLWEKRNAEDSGTGNINQEQGHRSDNEPQEHEGCSGGIEQCQA